MAEKTYIADKATQDAIKTQADTIKQDTTDILSQFPISGGTDLFAVTSSTIRYLACTATTTQQTLLSITGKGIFSGFMVRPSGSSYVDVSIVIDGVTVLNTLRVNNNDDNKNWFGLNIVFKSSLQIRAANQYTDSTSNIGCAYMLY